MEKSLFLGGNLALSTPACTRNGKSHGILRKSRDDLSRKVSVSTRALERRSSSVDRRLERRSSSVDKRLERRSPSVDKRLERRSSSLDKVLDDELPGSSRWDKVKSSYSSKEQWKPRKPAEQWIPPRKPASKAGDQRTRNVEDQVSREQEPVVQSRNDAETDEHEEPIQLHLRILEEAKKRAIVAKDYLKSLDVKKLKTTLDVRNLKNLDVKKLKTTLDVRKLKNLDVKKLISTIGDPSTYPPLSPVARTVITGLGAVLVLGILLDALRWRMNRSAIRNNQVSNDVYDRGDNSLRSRGPSSLSMLLERDLRRKESVEWVNMVIGKVWNLYRRALEEWMVGLLQPVIDDLEKPDYVQKVEVETFFLGNEPVTVRTVERRTSRRADDLQYHIGVRYTGGARLLLLITLKWGFINFTIPVGVRGLDVDAEVWVKLRMIPCDPWVGQATWAFVTLPRIKLALAPFLLVNVMAIPFLSEFLAKLLTEDLPLEFVRPNKNVVDLLQGRAIGPEFKEGIGLDGMMTFSGELSVTLIEARNMSYIPYLKTDPYCIFVLGEQVIRSKRNTQTSVIGPPGNPVWNQDLKLLVVDQKVQHMNVTLHDTIGFTSYTVGSADLDLKTLQDTIPIDRKLTLKSGWGPFPKRFAGELTLRLTYKAYVDEDEEVGGELTPKAYAVADVPVEQVQEVATFFKEEAGKVAEFFEEKDLAKEMFSSLSTISTKKDVEDTKQPNGIKPPADSDAPAVVTSATGSVKGHDQVAKNGGVAAKNASDGSSAKTSATGSLKGHDQVAKNGGVAAESASDGSSARKSDREQVIVSNQPGQESESSSVGQVFLWLAVATGVVWLVAADLNLENLFNP